METPAVGSVVLVPFPFSDLSGSKKRPALVLATAAWDDPMLCQITGQQSSDPTAIEISPSDIDGGSLDRTSFVRVSKIFTASPKLITRVIGKLWPHKFAESMDSLVNFLLSSKESYVPEDFWELGSKMYGRLTERETKAERQLRLTTIGERIEAEGLGKMTPSNNERVYFSSNSAPENPLIRARRGEILGKIYWELTQGPNASERGRQLIANADRMEKGAVERIRVRRRNEDNSGTIPEEEQGSVF